MPSTFFGATSSGFLNGSTYSIWWPNDSSASSPPISIGAAGKESASGWGRVDDDPTTLSWTADSTATGGYWTGIPNWGNLDAYVTAAQGSGVPVTYTFFEVPQWAVCFDYGAGNGGQRYGGPTGQNSAAKSCPLPGIGAPYNTVYSGTAGNCPNYDTSGHGEGWCPGPGYNPSFTDLKVFAKQLVNEYANFGTLHGTNQVAIKYYEIWNEPDAAGGAFWAFNSGVPDWTDLIKQTYTLENAINAQYSADSISASYPPIFIGPGIASRGNTQADSSLCGSCGGSAKGFLNTSVTLGGVPTTGASLISIGSFHLYPAYDVDGTDPDDSASGNTGDCSNTGGGATYSTVECTGANLVSAVTDRLNDFHAYAQSVSQVFMTEGSWMHNDNFVEGSQALIYQDMRAYVARYTLLMAATNTSYISSPTAMNVNQQHWFSWVNSLGSDGDDGYGTLCDDLSNSSPNYPCYTKQNLAPYDIYGGFAYGQVINWLSGYKITPCSAGSGSPAPCTDNPSSIWALPITVTGSSPTELAVWTWDGASVTCPGATGCPSLTAYGHYQTVKATTVNSLGSSITFGEEPILLEP